jgi:rod shape-determining protein MreD
VAITYTSGEQVEVYRFSIPATVLIPLAAVFLQAFLPLRFPFFTIFDLPLLVTDRFRDGAAQSAGGPGNGQV